MKGLSQRGGARRAIRQHAIMIKSAESNSDLLETIKKAGNHGLEVQEFTREMITTTDDKKVLAMTLEKNFEDIERLGVLVFGPKDVVEDLTKEFPLFK